MSAFGGKADMTVCGCLLSWSLSGVKRTPLIAPHMSAFDPKRTWGLWCGMSGPICDMGCAPIFRRQPTVTFFDLIGFAELTMIGRLIGTALWVLWLSGATGGTELLRIAHLNEFPPIFDVQDGKSIGLAADI